MYLNGTDTIHSILENMCDVKSRNSICQTSTTSHRTAHLPNWDPFKHYYTTILGSKHHILSPANGFHLSHHERPSLHFWAWENRPWRCPIPCTAPLPPEFWTFFVLLNHFFQTLIRTLRRSDEWAHLVALQNAETFWFIDAAVSVQPMKEKHNTQDGEKCSILIGGVVRAYTHLQNEIEVALLSVTEVAVLVRRLQKCFLMRGLLKHEDARPTKKVADVLLHPFRLFVRQKQDAKDPWHLHYNNSPVWLPWHQLQQLYTLLDDSQTHKWWFIIQTGFCFDGCTNSALRNKSNGRASTSCRLKRAVLNVDWLRKKTRTWRKFKK